MTNLQLLLSIGIPSVLVLLGWFQTNTQLARVEAAVDQLDAKTDARFDRLATEMVALRVDLNRDMTALRDSIHRDMIALHERVAVVEVRNR